MGKYNKPGISRIQVDRQIYPSYAKIRLKRSEIKGIGTIVPEILSEICEDLTCEVYCIMSQKQILGHKK